MVEKGEFSSKNNMGHCSLPLPPFEKANGKLSPVQLILTMLYWAHGLVNSWLLQLTCPDNTTTCTSQTIVYPYLNTIPRQVCSSQSNFSASWACAHKMDWILLSILVPVYFPLPLYCGNLGGRGLNLNSLEPHGTFTTAWMTVPKWGLQTWLLHEADNQHLPISCIMVLLIHCASWALIWTTTCQRNKVWNQNTN